MRAFEHGALCDIVMFDLSSIGNISALNSSWIVLHFPTRRSAVLPFIGPKLKVVSAVFVDIEELHVACGLWKMSGGGVLVIGFYNGYVIFDANGRFCITFNNGSTYEVGKEIAIKYYPGSRTEINDSSEKRVLSGLYDIMNKSLVQGVYHYHAID